MEKFHEMESYTAEELMEVNLPLTEFYMDGILPKGLAILSGKPKTGKSILALEIAAGVASGKRVLGTYETKQTKVLYVALEDSFRRLHQRIDMMMEEGEFPKELILTTHWPRMDDYGRDYLKEWLEKRHPDCELVVIDTFQMIRPGFKSRNVYAEDYRAIGLLKKLADEFEICILVVHHHRKAPTNDPIEAVGGTFGITGAADTVLTLERERGKLDGVLTVTGRDVEEQQILLRFDENTFSWQAVDLSSGYIRTAERQEIVDLLRRTPFPLSPKMISEILGKNHATIRKLLEKMVSRGDVKKVRRGLYTCTKIFGPVSLNPDDFDRSVSLNPDDFAEETDL